MCHLSEIWLNFFWGRKEKNMLHFKALVTVSGHLSDKIFISSHFNKITETYSNDTAYMLHFQKILGFPITGRLEIAFLSWYVSKNTSKTPFFHDKISCPNLHKVKFCKTNDQLSTIRTSNRHVGSTITD